MDPSAVTSVPFAFEASQHNPLNTVPHQPQGLAFTEEAGKTSPVLCRAFIENKQIEQAVGLKPWMIELKKTIPPLPVDTLSNAQPHLAVTKHLVWDVKNVNFDARTLDATATYDYRNKVLDTANAKGNDMLTLDVKGLKIHSVKIDGIDVPFKIIENPNRDDPNKFDALQITIATNKSHGTVAIDYTTNRSSSIGAFLDR